MSATLEELTVRVADLEAAAAETALEHDHLKAVTANLVLVVWAMLQADGEKLTGPLSVKVELAARNAAAMLGIPLAA